MSKWEIVKLGDVCDSASSNLAQKDFKLNNGRYSIYGASGFIKKIDFYKQEHEYIGIVKDGAGIGRATHLPAQSSIIGTMQYILPKNTVHTKYLYYAITNMGLSKYFTGSTIPHIYFKDYCKEKLPLPPIDIQKKIADELDKIIGLIEKRKTQIEKMDLLVKAKFVEMFGDPVTNPMCWEKNKLKEIAHSRLGEMLDKAREIGENKYPYLANFNVKLFKINLEKLNFMNFNAKECAEFSLKKGDVLVCEGGAVGRAAVWENNIEQCYFQKALHRVRCNVDIINPYYLNFWFFMVSSITGFEDIIGSKSTIPHLTGEKLKTLEILLPPIRLQNKFADYVKLIDNQKETMQNALVKLETLYKAQMQAYFE